MCVGDGTMGGWIGGWMDGIKDLEGGCEGINSDRFLLTGIFVDYSLLKDIPKVEKVEREQAGSA